MASTGKWCSTIYQEIDFNQTNHIDQLLRLSAWPLRFTMIGTNKFKMENIWTNPPFYAVSIDFCWTTKNKRITWHFFFLFCLLNQLIIFVLPKIHFLSTDVSYTSLVFVLIASVNAEQCWLSFGLILIHLSHQRSALQIALWYSWQD